MSAIDLVTDTFRWWGFLAGVICLTDWSRRVRFRLAGTPYPSLAPWWDANAKALVGLFLVIAGGTIPLTTRLDGFSRTSPSFLAGMALAWGAVSAAGWCYAVSRAPRPSLMIASAGLALPAILLAAALTADAA